MDLKVTDLNRPSWTPTEGLLVPKEEPEDSIFVASGLCETLIEDEDPIKCETKSNDDESSKEMEFNQPNVSSIRGFRA